MGNQSTKKAVEKQTENIERCPQRNRNIKNINSARSKAIIGVHKCPNGCKEKVCKNETKMRQKLSEASNPKFESQEKLPVFLTDGLNTKQMENSSRVVGKNGRKKKFRKIRTVEGFKEAGPPKLNVAAKKQTTNLKKRCSSKVPTQHDPKLISDILNTVAELESTFVDEKKYERRLRSAFSKQVEDTQQLKLSLHIEKQRNNRLMQLMNNYDNPETYTIKENDTEKTNNDKLCSKYETIELNNELSQPTSSNWSHPHIFSNIADTSVSSMLVRQDYEELTKSYAKCQAELHKKDKCLTLAYFKQEALQANYDKLSDELLTSRRKIESLLHMNAKLRNRKANKKNSVY